MTGPTPTVRERHGHDALLAATDQHPFIRFDVPTRLTQTWWETDGAVAFRRVRHTGRLSLSLLGDDAGVTALLDHLPAVAGHDRTVADRGRPFGVSVPQHLEPLLAQRFRVGPGGDWEWFFTEAAPTPTAGHERVVPLDDLGRFDEVAAFLAEHSPTADIAPGVGEAWFAIERTGGRLAAVAASGVTPVGVPHLASVAVDPALRGRGLGRTIVGALTRRAVAEHGVCTLSMYSHNAVARRLYLSLGYERACAWASRAVVLPR